MSRTTLGEEDSVLLAPLREERNDERADQRHRRRRQRGRHAMRALAGVVVGLTGLIGGLLASAPPSEAAEAFRSAPGLASELAYMLNNERTAVGLQPLVVYSLGAQSWANQLAAAGAFYHASGLGVDAENIASLPSGSPTGEAARMWMGSDGHRTNLLNPYATALDVGIACAAGRMVVVARFHQAWSTPTAPAVAPATPPGVGNECDSLSPASIGMPLVSHTVFPAGNPAARVGDNGWVASPSGAVVFDTWVANRTVVPLRVLVSLPCGSAWLDLTAASVDHVACTMAAPPDWVAYHSVAEVFDAAWSRIGAVDGWMCSRSA